MPLNLVPYPKDAGDAPAVLLGYLTGQAPATATALHAGEHLALYFTGKFYPDGDAASAEGHPVPRGEGVRFCDRQMLVNHLKEMTAPADPNQPKKAFPWLVLALAVIKVVEEIIANANTGG